MKGIHRNTVHKYKYVVTSARDWIGLARSESMNSRDWSTVRIGAVLRREKIVIPCRRLSSSPISLHSSLHSSPLRPLLPLGRLDVFQLTSILSSVSFLSNYDSATMHYFSQAFDYKSETFSLGARVHS